MTYISDGIDKANIDIDQYHGNRSDIEHIFRLAQAFGNNWMEAKIIFNSE